MLELAGLNSSNSNYYKRRNLSYEEMRYRQTGTCIAIVFYLIIFVWALNTAINAPDDGNKIVHLLFAVVSPFFYLLFAMFNFFKK